MASPVATSVAYQSNGTAHKWWVLVAVGLGTFMSALDGSVVNTVLPVITRAFNTDIAAIEWVVTIYLLVLSGLLLSFGRLGDIKGNKPVYITGFIIFLVSSALCGFAPSVLALVIFRALQALGAAMLAANSPAILTKSFPAGQRGQALGIQATMTYLGLMVGPILGGWLTDLVSWRVVFYINVPVALLAVWLSLRFIEHDRSTASREPFDLAGAFVFIAGLVALLLALNQGHSLGWTSPLILALLFVSFLLLGLFVWIETHVASPMLDLSLFLNRLFSASVSSAVLNYICVYSILFLMPFYLIQGRGLNPSQAGILLTAMPVVMAIVAPFSGTVSDRLGTRLPSFLGMIILSGGLLLLSRLDAQSPLPQVALSLGVAGLGIGIFVSPNNSALMGSAPRHRQGIAAGILATARNVGMVLGVGLTGAILSTVLARYSEASSAPLYTAIHASSLVAAILAALGALIAAIRPSQNP
jgi:EmrB/QacA subfamily drug resistance transporter